MNKILLTFAAILLVHLSTRAQDIAPLQLGNVWVYDYGNEILGRAEVVDSSFFIDTIKYFGIAEGYFGNDRALRLTGENYYVMKEDSSFPEPLNERIYYKKNALLGDTWQVNFPVGGTAVYTIIDTFPAYTFDTLVTGKMLNENFGLVEWDYVWTEEFGQLAALDWLGEVQYYLKGCVIDGVVYGDTTFIVVSVDDVTTLLSYELFQNYPNPFNSSTQISYSIAEDAFVTLKVYDMLGNEVAVLVNTNHIAGNYTAEFNAQSLSSGIYIYRITAMNGDRMLFSESKQMVLLK